MARGGWLAALLEWRRRDREIDEELRFHLEMEEEKLRAQGMGEGEARRQARLRFGGTEKWRHEVRDVDGIGPLERLRADSRFGLRVLRRNPVFAGVAIVTLALGIGASTAIFSVVDGILLRPLAYDDPDELVTVWADYTGRGGPEREWWGYPNFWDVRQATALAALDEPAEPAAVDTAPPMPTAVDDRGTGSDAEAGATDGASGAVTAEQEPDAPAVARPAVTPPATAEGRVFGELALWSPWNPTLTGRGDAAEVLNGARVGEGMLGRVLRVRPILGQSFRPEDDVPGAPQVVLLSERLWRSSFGADPDVVGSTLRLNGESYEVLGVLPGSFRQPLVAGADLWTTFRWDITDHPGGRGSAMVRVVGRLAPGVDLDQARARVDQVGARLEAAYPESLTGIGLSVFPLKDDIVGPARTSLLLLLAAVVATLLIVCVNLANLLLARGTARRREFSMRSALGASRGRLLRQLLTESVLLAGLGGLLGIVVAVAGTRFLVSLAPAGTPRIEEVGVDLRVLGFALAVSFACGVIFGLLPALRAARTRLAGDLGRSAAGGSAGSERVSEVLVAVQVAGALVLLIGAGLVLQSFLQLTRSNLGYRPEGVVSAFVFASPSQFPEMEQVDAYLDRAEAELRTVPGVVSLARVDTMPLQGANGDLGYHVEGAEPARPGEEHIAWFRRATPGYFSTIGIELVAGRTFLDTDDESSIPVVLVNETLARREFGAADAAVGKRLDINGAENRRWREIVGVVSDIKNFDLREDARPAMYAPWGQVSARASFFVMRGEPDREPDQILADARARLAAFDPDLAPTLRTVSSYVEDARALDRFVTWLLGLFASVAMVLAAVGLYGVISYRVGRRAREIGLRLALGARGSVVGGRVVARSVTLAALGVVFGVLGAAALTRTLRSVLYQVEPTDPFTFLGVAALMLAVSGVAALVPAWRAARVDPVKVLRED